MAAVAFASVARQDAENARLMIPSLAQAQQLNEDQIQELRDIVAWRLMGNDVTDEQAKWRDDAIMRSQSTSLIERRVRMALGTGDRRGLNTWLARLPMEAKEKDEWRYWQADLLLERGREAEAKEILHQLMQQRGFYPMVAAQRIGEEYELKIDKAPQNVDSALTQGPEMARVRELMYWNLDNTARSEWANLVKSKSKQSRLNWLGMLSITNGGILAFRQRSPGSCGIIWKSDSRWLTTIFSNATPVVRRSRKAMRWRLPVRRVPGIRK